MLTRQAARLAAEAAAAAKASEQIEEQNQELELEQIASEVQEQTQEESGKCDKYNNRTEDIGQQEHKVINNDCEDDEVQERAQKESCECNNAKGQRGYGSSTNDGCENDEIQEGMGQQEYDNDMNDGCEDDKLQQEKSGEYNDAKGNEVQQEYNNDMIDGCEDNQIQQENSSKFNNDNTKYIGQQEYDIVINDGCEDSENEEELESLLKKAEESLWSSQNLKNKNEKMQNEFSFPSLNVGISVDEQLYIKKHPGGVATLRQDAIVIQDNILQNRKIFNKVVQSSSKSTPTTDNDDQESCAKLSKKEKQKLRESTTGPGWFDMKKPEITPEVKRDLQIIKLRNVLDPKRFYKKDDSKGLPKYFEVGTIKEGPTEFYSSRIPRRERKQTIADELLADERSRNYFKRKFVEIQEVKQSGGKKYYKNLKAKRKPVGFN